METKCKKYRLEDYDRAVEFLRDLYRTSKTTPYWLPQRWEYAEYFVSHLHKDRGYPVDWKETIYYWETERDEIVAILCSESPSEDIFIHTKPDFRYLEEEMIKMAEEKIIPDVLKKKTVKIWTQENDEYRESLLQKLGYRKDEYVEYLNWKNLDEDLPEYPLPQGYSVHDMENEDGLDLQLKIDKLTGAFESKTYPIEIYRHLQSGPSYRKKYDLYLTDENGNYSSFCFIWYDKDLNIAYFEPVATDKDHQRMGLGRALLNVGLHRLKEDGVKIAYVGAAEDHRMAFYDASGFNNRVAFHPWIKEL